MVLNVAIHTWRQAKSLTTQNLHVVVVKCERALKEKVHSKILKLLRYFSKGTNSTYQEIDCGCELEVYFLKIQKVI